MTQAGQSSHVDLTADAGIDVGQRWRDRHTGDHFKVLRTYRDHPTNPTFLIECEPPRRAGTAAASPP